MEKSGFFVLIALLACIAMWFGMRFAIRRGRRILRFIQAFFASWWRSFVSLRGVVAFRVAHPRIVLFVQGRTSLDSFWGLPLSLLIVAFLYALLAFFDVVQDIATANVFAAIDVRIENLLYAVRSVPVTKFFLWVTMLGSWQVSFTVLVGASIILYVWKRGYYIVPVWVTVIGSQLVGLISKHEIHRPRPVGVAVYLEQSFSFPSGHAIIAVALYGFLAYIAMRQVQKWRHKIYILFAGVSLVILIGLSRLYVGVHYVSDIWGGYLLGFLWFVIGVSLAEWLVHTKYRVFLKPLLWSSSSRAVVSSIVGIAVVCVYVGIGRSSIASIPLYASSLQTQSLLTHQSLDIFSDGAPEYAETLAGNRQEPISLIITASSEDEFKNAFTRAGWNSAQQMSVRSVPGLIFAASTSGAYPTAPITPSFWNQEVNDFAFQKPTPLNSIRERHHARFWRTPYVTDTGERVYVGTASLDTHLKWFVTHAISPDIDQERENLVHDLVQGGEVAHTSTVQLVAPEVGKNIFGDSFFTDGKAYVIELK